MAFLTSDIDFASQQLVLGNLVAFPTETVYGLGANALNENAVKKIFQVKGRSSTNPLIVHITDKIWMEKLWNISQEEILLANLLADKFWSGPLTIVAKASIIVPSCVTANSGYVGLRYPNHNIAQELITKSNLPIAAPSANLSKHISPTSAQHVFDDLYDKNIIILDSYDKCQIGIESTVIKIISKFELCILRVGFISQNEIYNYLNDKINNLKIYTKENYCSEDKMQDCPGQQITHYSPKLPSFLIDIEETKNTGNMFMVTVNEICYDPSVVIIIDFGDLLSSKINVSRCKEYFNLSHFFDVEEATYNLFDVLRKAENIENAQIIIFPIIQIENYEKRDLILAINDRLFRAASGIFAQLF